MRTSIDHVKRRGGQDEGWLNTRKIRQVPIQRDALHSNEDPGHIPTTQLTFSAAPASATAILTPKMAFAPSFPLLAVPSSLRRKSSMSFWDVTLSPDLISSGPMVLLTFATALETPDTCLSEDKMDVYGWTNLCRGSLPCRHHVVRRPHEYRSRHQREQQP